MRIMLFFVILRCLIEKGHIPTCFGPKGFPSEAQLFLGSLTDEKLPYLYFLFLDAPDNYTARSAGFLLSANLWNPYSNSLNTPGHSFYQGTLQKPIDTTKKALQKAMSILCLRLFVEGILSFFKACLRL